MMPSRQVSCDAPACRQQSGIISEFNYVLSEIIDQTRESFHGIYSTSHERDLLLNKRERWNVSYSVLLIEDDAEIRELMKISLETAGFKVYVAENGDGIIAKIDQLKPSILFVDQTLPELPGIDIVKEIRCHSMYNRLPIMMVTGRDSEDEKVLGLSAGADDYVTKPFSQRELVARARAILRRSESGPGRKNEAIVNGNLTIDLEAHRATLNQEELHLTLTEFKILSELLNQGGRILSRLDLCGRVLGRTNVTDRTIDVHVSALRKKMGARGDDIQTVRGVGYRFDFD